MTKTTSQTYQVKIYVAAIHEYVSQLCQEFCFSEGLCVTVEPTAFIYTGGREEGSVVGLLNYPRFPSSNEEVASTAERLAEFLLIRTYQYSALVVTPEQTVWIRADEVAKNKGKHRI